MTPTPVASFGAPAVAVRDGVAVDVAPMAALAQAAGLQLTHSDLEMALAKAADYVWLVAQDASGASLGCAWARVLPDELEIYDVVVATDARRKGVGRALVHSLIAAACRLRLERLVLEVACDNRAACALYASCNFVPQGLRRGYYGRANHGPGLGDAHIMARATLPPGGRFFNATIVAHEPLAADLGWVELAGPDIAQGAQAGHFAMLGRPGELASNGGRSPAPRPYAYCQILNPNRVRLLVRERPGLGPSFLRAPVGTPVPGYGPLGRPFAQSPKRLWAVAGGVGAAAFGALVPHPQGVPPTLFLGLKSAAEANLVEAMGTAWASHGGSVRVSCDDGTLGHPGSVLDGLRAALVEVAEGGLPAPEAIWACGPEGMLRAVAQVAATAGIPCVVSLGLPMACGIGVCGSCSHLGADTTQLLACVDGPVYAAERLYGDDPLRSFL